MAEPFVQALFVYPIKALRGVALDAVEATPLGLRHDRRMVLVDPQGRFVTRRELPALARMQVELHTDAIEVIDGASRLRVPLDPTGPAHLDVTVWRTTTRAVAVSAEADDFFSSAMGRRLRLAYMPEAHARPVNPARVPGGRVSFADGYPVLVVTQAAVDAVSADVGAPMSVHRFRPNVVLGGAPAYAEDDWPGFSVGSVGLRHVKPCGRCVVITQDPDTGAGAKEPLRTLARTRTRDGEVVFGQNAMLSGAGWLRNGDPVRVWSSADE